MEKYYLVQFGYLENSYNYIDNFTEKFLFKSRTLAKAFIKKDNGLSYCQSRGLWFGEGATGATIETITLITDKNELQLLST